jgi:sulfite reductase alpha subunit-like flavoprotein
VLGDVVFQVFGVGDSGYERFNWAGKGMRRGLLRLGGREILEDIKGEACWGDERSAGG